MPDSPEKNNEKKILDLIIGESQEIKKVVSQALTVAKFLVTVFLSGPSGVGKELIARLIHEESDRSGGPFVVCDCGALKDSLEESELFGHVKGAFTDATMDKTGYIESADGGTLFLDEIQNLAIQSQKKLLRVLQEKMIVKVGSTKGVHVDFRLIVATNQNIHEMIQKNEFREDLFYRIYVNPIDIPSLSDRGDDIIIIAKHFIKSYCNEFKFLSLSLSKKAEQFFKNYHWPGNIRELANVCERLVLNHDHDNQIIERDFVKNLMAGEFSRGVINDDNFIPELWSYIVYHQNNLEEKQKENSNEQQADNSEDQRDGNSEEQQDDNSEEQQKGNSKEKKTFNLKDVEKQLIRHGLVIKQSRKAIAEILGVNSCTITRKIDK